MRNKKSVSGERMLNKEFFEAVGNIAYKNVTKFEADVFRLCNIIPASYYYWIKGHRNIHHKHHQVLTELIRQYTGRHYELLELFPNSKYIPQIEFESKQ